MAKKYKKAKKKLEKIKRTLTEWAPVVEFIESVLAIVLILYQLLKG